MRFGKSMKRVFAFVLCLLTLASIGLLLSGCGEETGDRAVIGMEAREDLTPPVKTVALADDYAPYCIPVSEVVNDSKDNVSGIDVEAAQAIAGQMDVSFEYVLRDGSDLMTEFKDKEYDMALCGFSANEADRIQALKDAGLSFSKSCYGYIQGVLVDSSSNIKSLNENNILDTDCKIGVKKDSTAEAMLRRDIPDADERVFSYDTGVDAVNAIVAREVNCVVTDINPAYEYEEQFDSIKLLSEPYSHGAFYFISSDSALIGEVNAALESLDNGTINSIEEKYIRSDVDFWTPFKIWFNKLKYDFRLNFIEKDRWKFLVTGLGNTMLLTLLAACLGMVIGIIIAAIRTTYDNNLETLQHRKGLSYYVLKFFNAISKFYLTVIRGTPVFVQLLIIFFVIFATSKNKMMVAVLAFGINSGAYVAEILRGGIMAIDKGQFEAGRSIGFNYVQTMLFIIIPQVLKNVLPTLLNEFIALLKETSVACYVGVLDLTRAGNIIRGTTFTDLLPLLAVALIYLVVVLILTRLVSILERRLRKSER